MVKWALWWRWDRSGLVLRVLVGENESAPLPYAMENSDTGQ